MEELQKAAKIAFSTEYAFVIKAQNFHWNVESADFLEYHELFGKIYEEVYASIDDFAEKIRTTGAYVPASFTRFSMLTQIEDENNILPKELMSAELLKDNEKIIKILKLVYDLAEREGKHGFSNFLAERMDAHEKHGWMLRSSLRGN
jgi:starvation-inducible DNA-binding protein